MLRDENKRLRNNVESKKSTIFKSVAVGATVLGAVGSVILGGPIGLGLFAAFAEAGPAMLGGLAAGGAVGGLAGGAGIGAAAKKWFPRKWFGEQLGLSKAMKRLQQSLKNESCGVDDAPSNTPVESSETHDNTTSSPSDTETTPLIPNNEVRKRSSNTESLSDHAPATQSNAAVLASISGNMQTADTTTSNSTVESSGLTISTNNTGTSAFVRNDYSYLPQLAVNTFWDVISYFRPQQN